MICLKIELIDNQTIKVTLKSTDMAWLGITFAELDYKKPETKKAIFKILKYVNSKTSICLSADKISIEAFPFKNKSCILYINAFNMKSKNHYIRKNETLIKSYGSPVIYEIHNISALLDAYQVILLYKESISIYSYNGKYYFLIYPESNIYNENKSSRNMKKKLLIANEYGQYIGEGEVKGNFLKEYGKFII